MDKSAITLEPIEKLAKYLLAAAEIERVEAKAKKALKRALKTVDELAQRPNEVFGAELYSAHSATLEAGLAEICHAYFRERALSKMRKNLIDRKELVKLSEDCKRLFETWKRLSPQSLLLLSAEFNVQKFSAGFHPKKLGQISRAVDAIVNERKQRLDEIPAIKFTAKRCSDLLKRIGAIDVFPENFIRYNEEYTSASARFVELILRSIDKNMSLPNIKTAMREINK